MEECLRCILYWKRKLCRKGTGVGVVVDVIL